jgi:hypothetical protein
MAVAPCVRPTAGMLSWTVHTCSMSTATYPMGLARTECKLPQTRASQCHRWQCVPASWTRGSPLLQATLVAHPPRPARTLQSVSIKQKKQGHGSCAMFAHRVPPHPDASKEILQAQSCCLEGVLLTGATAGCASTVGAMRRANEGPDLPPCFGHCPEHRDLQCWASAALQAATGRGIPG